jgi:hypothetical protein
MPLVFQYGSNCSAERLNALERLAGDAKDCGRAETVEEFDLAFDVWSQTNGCAASDMVRASGTGRRVWGVLYEIPAELIRGKRKDGTKTLAQIEGSRYEEGTVRVLTEEGREVEAVTFLVKADERCAGLWTSFDYVQHIVRGLRDHEIAEECVQRVIDVAIRTNSQAAQTAADQTRSIEKLRLPPTMTKPDYLKFRDRFTPPNPKIIFVLESPPASGRYFYNPDGPITEPLFRAMMKDVLEIAPDSKEQGLTQFAAGGYLIVDATYTRVNKLKDKEADAIIDRDFAELVEDLREHAGPGTAIVLVKANVCALLESKLKDAGFNVLNKGVSIPFPGSGQHTNFRNSVRAVLGRKTP